MNWYKLKEDKNERSIKPTQQLKDAHKQRIKQNRGKKTFDIEYEMQ